MFFSLYKLDIYRWNKQRTLLPLIPQLKIIKYKRICEYLREKKSILYPLFYYWYRKIEIKYNTDIPVQTKIGKGFLIEHIGGIVINPSVIIGSNCNIYNGVVIGTEKRGKRKGTPIIGNSVWIGANSVIVGHISIGDDVLIAPGSYINFNVPPHSIVIGNPAKIIKREKATESYIKNKVGDFYG